MKWFAHSLRDIGVGVLHFPHAGSRDRDEQSWENRQPLNAPAVRHHQLYRVNEFFKESGRIRLASEFRRSESLSLSFMIFVFFYSLPAGERSRGGVWQ